ncbi:ShlB/FhaC/HecB family hemolysin secretion/activation protein [Leminorella richardii]|uniref:ShlB/FhaC/HecB family hemolysin secretion/activation protein n=1 Tax=Leminorella richardii TaxID=158841 RepID=UPI002F961CF6
MSAALVSPADQATIEHQQKVLLDRAQQQREVLQNTISVSELPLSNEHLAADSCQNIHHIDLQGASLLPPSTTERLLSPWRQRCMSLSDISTLVRDITQAYLERGYITSQAWLPEQDISSGILVIRATEGKTESITLEGGSSILISMAFPDLIGKAVNLRDLEQGLEQMNRLSSRSVTIDIQPGTIPGYSQVVLIPAEWRFPARVNISVDNSGQKSTGSSQLSASLVVDNPLRFADQWTVSASRDGEFHHDRQSRSFSISATLPYGYWLFSTQYSWSDFYQTVPANAGTYRYDGTVQAWQAGVNRTLYRDGSQRFALDIALSRRRTENRLAGTRLSISSPTLTSLTSGLGYSRVLGGGYVTFNPAITIGLKEMGATRDSNAHPDAPRSEFRRFSLSASYFYPLSPSLTYMTSFYGQTSPDNLYASERISAGGIYSVRGFKEQSLTGNRGGYWRNELNWQAMTLPDLGELSFTGALDGGHIIGRRRLADGGDIAGISAGFSLHGSQLSQSLTIGAPLVYPNSLEPDRWVVYWLAGVSF